MEAIFVTSNAHKLREAREILGFPIESKSVELDEIQSMDLDAIIRHKLKHAWELLGQPVLVDDVGLYFEAWGGFPGPFIRHAAETMGEAGLALALGDDRRCRYLVNVGYQDENRTLIGSGEVMGTYIREARGEHGWGFDPYLLPDGSEQTYAELRPEAKNAISARANALQDLKRQLEAL